MSPSTIASTAVLFLGYMARYCGETTLRSGVGVLSRRCAFVARIAGEKSQFGGRIAVDGYLGNGSKYVSAQGGARGCLAGSLSAVPDCCAVPHA